MKKIAVMLVLSLALLAGGSAYSVRPSEAYSSGGCVSDLMAENLFWGMLWGTLKGGLKACLASEDMKLEVFREELSKQRESSMVVMAE